MDKKWIISSVSHERVQHLQQALGIAWPICEVLVKRGIHDFHQAKSYFRPELSHLHDPMLMKDMSTAVDRIITALNNREKICIYGDYDVDGTTSVSVLYHFLMSSGVSSDILMYYLPDRQTEGYGLSLQGVEYAAQQGAGLMILTDCGIKDVDKVAVARSYGMEVIILDHHIPGDIVPEAIAILNPKQHDCAYPFKELSACGIVFKLICALADYLPQSADPFKYLDWVTLSIASDIVPIIGENRIIAFHGLKAINTTPRSVIRLFKSQLALADKPLNISDLVFKIGPKINASGRMTHAQEVVKLFLARNADEQQEQLNKLFQDNALRQSIDKDMTDAVFEYLDSHLQPHQKSIVVYDPDWHKGIVGIVASRIVERYYKPTVVLTYSNGVVMGSARSVQGFDLYEAIDRCRPHLLQFGGHAFAAGLRMEETSLQDFKEAFEASVAEHITASSLYPEIIVDADITLDQITSNFAKIIDQFEPCGPHNPSPIFRIQSLYDTGFSKVVKDVHAQLFLSHHPRKQGSPRIKGIAFNLGEWIDHLRDGKPIDVVAHVEQDIWNGVEYLQLRIIDIKASSLTAHT